VTVFLVNAAHVKQVPGRKTDKADARWLAKLMRDGLLQASFILPAGQRALRDLTRYRTTLVQERTREVNRVPGVLERANITLASVATDILGVSGRAILAALVEGHADPATMAELAKGRLRSQIPLLEQALTGRVRDHHRQLLTMHVAPIDFLEEQLEALSTAITRRVTALGPDEPSTTPADADGPPAGAEAPGAPAGPMTCARAITLLDTIPGVDQRGGERLGAEWGIDMARFGTAARLAAWTGVAPGNDESAGKRRSGRPRQVNHTLRTGLTQLAHAAARTKGTYLSAFYPRLATRRGKQRAIMAVARSMVVSAFHMLSRAEPYQDSGATYVDKLRQHQSVDRFIRQIERLGYRVSLEPVPAA
jgi:transposase